MKLYCTLTSFDNFCKTMVFVRQKTCIQAAFNICNREGVEWDGGGFELVEIL